MRNIYDSAHTETAADGAGLLFGARRCVARVAAERNFSLCRWARKFKLTTRTTLPYSTLPLVTRMAHLLTILHLSSRLGQ
jgi:hypothetical protein